MRHRSWSAISAAVALAASTALVTAGTSSAVTPADAGSAHAQPTGSFAYSGQQARDFALPSDVRELWQTTLADGRTQTRYQQVVDRATVFGGQITVIEDASGDAESVVGAYFPGLAAKNSVRIDRREAKNVVASDIGSRGDFSNELRLDPRNATLFYQVESIRDFHRPVRWVNAANGKVIKSFDAIAHGEGTGVKGDTKTIDTTQNASGAWQLVSAEGTGRFETRDMGNGTAGAGVVMTDADNLWNLAGGKSPGQPAAVDAHYYAGVVDDYFFDTFGRNSIDDQGMKVISRVHYDRNYCNAFWNGALMTYGDGNGRDCLALSGSLDVDGHELTHGVTDFTSNLIYENQSGALNEAFSDMMGNTIEFYADSRGLDPTVEPDWLIGEDVIFTRGDATPGFRNMADPAQDGDPDHWVNRYTGTADGGGVHTNSGIPNHAYYLSVTGGQNAGCTAGEFRTAPTHTEDCGVIVPAVGLARAEQIFYAGFTSLPEYANFCDARNATMATAGEQSAAIGLAWDAVGVPAGCTPASPPPPACEGSANASLPIESQHPYANNADCTWTYTNAQGGGFSFHFTLMDMEKSYDYVYVKDGNGAVLAAYTGVVRRSFSSPCISTPSGSVQMVTDPGVVAQGFTIDAVAPC